LYLLHQNIGTALIGWLSEVLNFRGYASAILAVLTACAVIMMAKLIYAYWEVPMDRLIVGGWKAHMSRAEAMRRAGGLRADEGGVHSMPAPALTQQVDESAA